MRYLIGSLLLLLIVLPAEAQDAPPPLYTIDGDITLNWQAPTENVDGTPLEDLDGYKIYWGETSRVYTQSFELSDEGLTSFPLTFPLDSENQTDWYFAMTALDSDGNESAYSNEVLKTVTVTITDNRPPAPPVLESVDMQLTCLGSSSDIICTITVTDG